MRGHAQRGVLYGAGMDTPRMSAWSFVLHAQSREEVGRGMERMSTWSTA